MRSELYIDLDAAQQACLDYLQAVYMMAEISRNFNDLQEELALGYKEGAFTNNIVKDEEQFGYYRINSKVKDFTELISVSQFAMSKSLEELGKADDYVKRIALNQIFDGLVENGSLRETEVQNLLKTQGVNRTYASILEQAEKGETINFDYTEMSEERTVSQGSRQYENTVSHYASPPKAQVATTLSNQNEISSTSKKEHEDVREPSGALRGREDDVVSTTSPDNNEQFGVGKRDLVTDNE